MVFLLLQTSYKKIMKEYARFNETMEPLSEFKGVDITDLSSCYEDLPRKFIDTWLYRLTYNGQRLWPTFLCKKGCPLVASNGYQPQKMAMHKHMLAVNPFAKTGVIRQMDKKRYRELQKRFRKSLLFYRKNHKQIERAYQEARPYLTSEPFWREYLGLK